MMPKLLSLIASRAGGLLNSADLSRSLGIPSTTLKRYLSLLELVFLVVPLQPWFSNKGKRLIKAPKIYVNDTGLLCHLIGVNTAAVVSDSTLMGGIVENFVMMELVKQLTWSETRANLYHFRTASGQR
jgi:uncharacterized protein